MKEKKLMKSTILFKRLWKGKKLDSSTRSSGKQLPDRLNNHSRKPSEMQFEDREQKTSNENSREEEVSRSFSS